MNAGQYDLVAAPPRDVNPAFIDQFVRHREFLARTAAGDGCRCVLALQPVIHVGKVLTPKEQRSCRLWGSCGPDFREFWPRMQAAAVRLNVPGALTVDLTDLFADFSGEAYLDECHYTSEGNRLIARRLADIIRSSQPIRSSPQTSQAP